MDRTTVRNVDIEEVTWRYIAGDYNLDVTFAAEYEEVNLGHYRFRVMREDKVSSYNGEPKELITGMCSHLFVNYMQLWRIVDSC